MRSQCRTTKPCRSCLAPRFSKSLFVKSYACTWRILSKTFWRRKNGCTMCRQQWSSSQGCEFFCTIVHNPVKASVDWIWERDRDQFWPFQNLVIIGATKTNWSANQEDTTKQLIIILPNLQRAIFHRHWLAEVLIGRRIIAWGSLLPYTVICGPIWQISPLWSLIFPILIFAF